MNVLFVGSSGILSLLPLAALNKSIYVVSAVATDDINRNVFSASTSGTIQYFSLKHSIPVIDLNDNNSDVVEQVKLYQPDVILVSCYNRLIPESILSLAKIRRF